MVVWCNRCFGCVGSKWGGRKSFGKLFERSRYSRGSIDGTDVSVSEAGVDMDESEENVSGNDVLVEVSE